VVVGAVLLLQVLLALQVTLLLTPEAEAEMAALEFKYLV
jgi:hypothetical protein